MKTLTKIISTLAIVATSGCGGGDDWQAPEVALCKSALVRLGGVAPSTLEGPSAISAIYDTSYGKLLDFSNGETPGTSRYASFGSCQIADTAVLRVVLASGAVVPGP